MTVVSASHPLGCERARLTVLGNKAGIMRVLPVGPDYSTSIRGPGLLSFLGNRMISAVAFPHTLKVLCH